MTCRYERGKENEKGSRLNNILLESGYLFHNGKDPWLAFLGAVGTNTEIDLLGVSIGVIAGCEGKDDIGGSNGDSFKERR